MKDPKLWCQVIPQLMLIIKHFFLRNFYQIIIGKIIPKIRNFLGPMQASHQIFCLVFLPPKNFHRSIIGKITKRETSRQTRVPTYHQFKMTTAVSLNFQTLLKFYFLLIMRSTRHLVKILLAVIHFYFCRKKCKLN